MLFEWNESLRLGIDALDADHQRLIDLINALDEGVRAGRGREKLGAILDELLDYTHYHFRREEVLFADYGYPDQESHRRSHRSLTTRAAEFADAYKAGRADLDKAFLDFLVSWLVNHVMKEDMAYREFLNRKRSGRAGSAWTGIGAQVAIIAGVALAGLAAAAILAAAAPADAPVAAISGTLFAALAITGVATTVAAVAIARRLARPCRDIVAATRRLADGETDFALPASRRGDEIGAIAGVVQFLKLNILEMQRSATERSEMERRAVLERRDAMQGIAENFRETVHSVVPLVGSTAERLHGRAESLVASMRETTAQCGAASSASEEVAANVEEVARASGELSQSIRHVNDQVAQAREIAAEAVGAAEHAAGTIGSLASAGERIGNIVKLIQAIAAQTNLLALNATIEAARAGEAGKGFAVVAGEVKNLASQTAKATEDISAQIAAIQSGTGDAVQEIRAITDVIGQVNALSQSIAAAMDQQDNATRGIARRVEEAAAGTVSVSSRLGHLTDTANASRDATQEVQTASNELAEMADMLYKSLDRFLEHLKTG